MEGSRIDVPMRQAGEQLQGARSAATDQLTYVGHATVALDIAGVRLLTDPVLRDRVVFLRRVARLAGAPGPASAVLGVAPARRPLRPPLAAPARSRAGGPSRWPASPLARLTSLRAGSRR